MTPPADPTDDRGATVTRIRKAYAQKACIQCRKQKVRCLAGSDGAEKCQRCHRMKLQCIFPDSKRAPKKRLLNNRVRELEQHIKGIKSLLESGPQPPSNRAPPTPTSSLLQETVDPNLEAENFVSESIIYRSCWSDSDKGDVIERGLLTLEHAQSLFSRYIQLSPAFPFVVIPEEASVESMRQESPMLLHAMFIASANLDEPLQARLEKDYMISVSMYTLIQGQKNMDLLQSLLVFLSRYHFLLKPGKKQVYRIASLAISIMYDLEIDRKPVKSEQQQMNVDISLGEGSPPISANPDFWSPDAMRAFIGCYFLSTLYAIIARKTPLMMYTDYLHVCANALANEGAAYDNTILPRLEVSRYADLVCETFGYRNSQSVYAYSDDVIQTYLTTFEARLQTWRESSAHVVGLKFNLPLAYDIMAAFTREIALYSNSKSSTPSIPRSKMLTECLIHVRDYMDAILALPVDNIANWTCTEWGMFHYMIILLVKVSTNKQTPVWNASTTRPIIKPEVYIDSISTIIRQIPGSNECVWFKYILAKMESLKAKYLAALGDDFGANVAQTSDQNNMNDISNKMHSTTLNRIDNWNENVAATSEFSQFQSGWQSGSANTPILSMIPQNYPTSFDFPAFPEDGILGVPYSFYSGLEGTFMGDT